MTTPPRIYLLSTIGNDVRLLENWLSYYSEFAFDGVYLSLQIRGPRDEGLVMKVEDIASSFGAVIGDYHRSPNYQQKERIERLKSAYCGPNDWAALADIDEFVEYTRPPRSLIDQCRKEGSDYVTGFFLDRLGVNGTFPSLDGVAGQRIWDLFPLGCHLTRDIARATVRKVVLASSSSTIGYGQHSATGRELPMELGTAIVHHFKWDAQAVQRTRYMLWLYAMQDEPWVVERLRVLRYLENRDETNGLLDMDTALSAYWPRYRRSLRMGGHFGDALDIGVDIPYTILQLVKDPTRQFIESLDTPIGRLDVVTASRVLFDNLADSRNFTEVTESVVAELHPNDFDMLSLEPWLQETARRLVLEGYARMKQV